jgi:3'-phosphoadenosine 5'-phosphosulfate sulfotransferase (PAPS reductase)/FAD synthetase
VSNAAALLASGHRFVASISGGKDSTATALHLRELGIPFECVHMDTGWETAETYRYVREVLPAVVGPITILRREVTLPADLDALARTFEAEMGIDYSPMVRTIIKKGMFPSRQRRFCTQELKVFPFRDWCRQQDADLVNVVGIRAEESQARATMPEWEHSDTFDCEVWRPLLAWTLDDVITIHHRHGVVPNRGYLDGASRVGCWPCIHARKSEIRRIADTDPGRIDLLERLEAEIARLAHERNPEHGAPAWFVNPEPTRTINEDGTVSRSGECVPIRDVVDWARTKHGGVQYAMFAATPTDAGCMRWGLCDVAGSEP